MASVKEQIEEIQRQIKQWQGDPSASAAMKRQLLALQSELDNLARQARSRPVRNRARLAVVQPKPPPQVALSPSEKAVWSSFFNFHKALLQYSGWVNRDQWLQMADVAADMTSGNPALADMFPCGVGGIWVWDGAAQAFVRADGLAFPTQAGIWGWDAADQRWVLIDGGEEMGVTDGSVAGSGRIGEVVEGVNATAAPVTITGAGNALIYNPVFSLTLSAGDWDISGSISFDLRGANATAPFVSASAYMTRVAPPGQSDGSGDPEVWDTTFSLQSNWEVAGAPLTTRRLSFAVPTTLYVTMVIGTPDPTDQGKTGAIAWGGISARRMR